MPEQLATIARRTLYGATYAVLVGASYLDATVNRFHQLARETEKADDGCPLCGGAMAKDRISSRLEWRSCTKCGQHADGVPVREAA